MQTRVIAYVLATVLAAVGALVCLYHVGPPATPDVTRAGFAFAALGLLCQAYVFRMNRAVAGTISFIPFLTAAALAPHWTTPLMVAVAVAVVELRRRPGALKATFNVGQWTLATAIATLAFVGLGGTSLHIDEQFRLLPYSALFATSVFANTIAVSGVVAVSTRQPWLETWRRQSAGTLKYDAAASPLVYTFALVYNRFGLAGIVFLAVLLLGARQLYSTNWKLEQSNRELLEVMVGAIELRDPYTSGHSQRVSEYSVVIARAIGLGHRQVDRVKIAALLHDVGKIDERFASILQKPGRLTDEERLVIEEHPVISAELVSKISGLADVVPSVRHHHERWDGRGYPSGLSGQTIPLYSRIISFADTIDAMTSDRPYRPALGSAEVRAELLRNRGKQFDPDMCDRLLASPLFQTLFERVQPSAKADRKETPIIAA